MSDQQQAPARLVIDVTVENGAVLPADQQLQGKVGQPVVVRINSDAADQLLARGAREHTFPVEAKAGQSFQFTPDAPGPVTITLQTLNQTVATVDVTQ